MDSFGFTNIKTEKTNALLKYKRIQRLKSTFLLLELCVFLIILSQFITHIPSVLKISGDYFRGLSVTAVRRPLFVFLISNAIVVVLILKSKDGDRNSDPINDFYEDYAKNSQRAIIKHEIKKEKKQLLCPEVVGTVKEKKMCRSRSENLKRLQHHKEGGSREIRRSVTERRQPKSVDIGEEEEKNLCLEDEMSNEEFRRTIEAFIARQQKALRDDEEI